MGIMDFVKSGVREMMIARPDQAKHLIVYKHPDQTIPMWSQLTVDSDEGVVFFKDGEVKGIIGPGRHTLDGNNIPFLSNLVDRFTGGNVFISEVFFVRSQAVRQIPFGGKLGMMEEPITSVMCEPRIYGEYALQVVDPVRFIVGYAGQRMQPNDNEVLCKWISDQFLMGVSEVLAKICLDEQTSLMHISAKKQTLGARFMQSVPSLDQIGVRIVELGNFNINFSPEEKQQISEIWKDFRSDVKKAEIDAKKRQFEINQKIAERNAYVQMAQQNPGYMQYAAGEAMIGAGQGMAQGGGDAGVAGLGAQMAVGVGMAGMMQPMFHQAATPPRVQGAAQCGKCGAQNAGGRFCASCGQPLAVQKTFCTQCGAEVIGKFCAGCGAPAPGPQAAAPQPPGYGAPPAPAPQGGGYPPAPQGGGYPPPGGQR